MKGIWSSDPIQIINELISIVELAIPLSIYSEYGSSAISTNVQSVCGYNGVDYFILQKPANWKQAKGSYIIYKKEGQPARGFILQVDKESEGQIAALIPREIFQVQRRKHLRIDTLPSSQATFLVKNKIQMSTCLIKDISLEGVCLNGIPAYELKVGDELGPLTLMLTMMKNHTEVYDITIPHAVVRWVIDKGDRVVDLGIFFKEVPKAIHEQLSTYFDLRTLELSETQ